LAVVGAVPASAADVRESDISVHGNYLENTNNIPTVAIVKKSGGVYL
jgi:hypothetical protein